MNVVEYKEMTRGSKLERLLAAQISWSDLPRPTREYAAVPDRKYRVDFCWEREMLAVELQGGCHTVRARWMQDIEKSQELLLCGWKVLYLSPMDVQAGRAVDLIRRSLKVCQLHP